MMDRVTIYLIALSIFVLAMFTGTIWAQEEASEIYTIYHFGVQNGETVTSGHFRLQRTESQLNVVWFSTRGPTNIMRNPMGYTIHHLIGHPQVLFELPVEIGNSWSGELAGIGPFIGAKGWTATTMVEGTPEEVTVRAGVFSDCVHLVTNVSGSGETRNGKPAPESLDMTVRGVRHFWFVAGVGLVKFQYQHADGSTTNIELLEYSRTSKSSELFPLSSGNTWKYRWTNTKHSAMVEESWVAAEGDPGMIKSLPENLALHYTVKIPDPKSGQIDVSASIKNFPQGTLVLEMQKHWARGKNLPGNVRNLEINNIGPVKPKIFRVDNSWLMFSVSKKEVQFGYTLEPKQRDFLQVEEEPTLTDKYCFIFGYGLFLIPKLGDRHYRDKIDIQVDFQVPDDWQIATTWGSRQKSYHPSSLHELRHAMIALGDYRLHAHKILEKDFTLVIRDTWPFTDEEYFQNAVKYVEYYTRLFNDYPVPYFLIILNKGGEGQGDKTNNSLSVVHNDRPEPPDEAKEFYFSKMNIPHEIFHIWEGKIKKTNGTRWVHEGFPTYYALKSFDRLRPKGTEEERQAAEQVFLNELNRWYGYDSSKSLEAGGEPYRKGALAALMLDVAIQKKTDARKSLDDLVVEMYRRFGPGSEAECTNRDIFSIASKLTGEDMDWFYDRYITTTTELALEETLEHLGYTIERKLGPIADFGMTVRGTCPSCRVESVCDGGPADKAGIKVGDFIFGYTWQTRELAARREPLDAATKQFEAMFAPDYPTRLDVMSGGKPSVVTVTPNAQPKGAYISKIQKAQNK